MTSDDEAPDQPFAGVRVVEFGQFVAVPYAAQLLADGGADVIKIEALDGDPTRRLKPLAPGETRIFVSRNRGKRSLPLALSEPGSKPVVDAALDWADVVLMNFRPGLAEGLGLDAATLCARDPRLIVGTVTAFGQAGPDADQPGMDIVVQARSGLMAANGRMIDERPAPGDPVSADYMCAMTLAFGVSSALLRRERTGRGGPVDTSLMQAAMTLMNNQLVRSEVHDAPGHGRVLERLGALRASGASYRDQLDVMPSIRAMPMLKVYFRTYETADAALAIACGSHALRVKFINAIGLEDPGLERMDDAGLADHYDALAIQAERVLREKTGAAWTDVFKAAGVPVSAVRFPVELFDDPQVRANAMLHTIDHPLIGPVTVVAPPVRLGNGGFEAAPATAAFGSETDAVMKTLGFSSSEIERLVEQRVTHRG